MPHECYVGLNSTLKVPEGMRTYYVRGSRRHGHNNPYIFAIDWQDAKRRANRRNYWLKRASLVKWDTSACNRQYRICRNHYAYPAVPNPIAGNEWRDGNTCYCGAKRIKLTTAEGKTRLNAAMIASEIDEVTRVAMASVYGYVKFLAQVGSVVESDSEYDLLAFDIAKDKTIRALRCKKDGTLALVEGTTISDSIFDALTSGFRSV